MNIESKLRFSERSFSECLIIPFFEDKVPEIAADIDIDKRWMVSIENKDFFGKKKELSLLYVNGEKEKRVLLLGLGKKEDINLESIITCFSEGIKRCQSLKIDNISIAFPKKCEVKDLYRILLESIFLSNYLYHKLKRDSLKDEKVKLIEKVEIIGVKEDKELIEKIKTLTISVNLVRDLVNNNADDTTPKRLADLAEEFSKISKKIKTTVFDKKRIEKEKMGLIQAVNKGSPREPYFIVLDYTSKKSNDRTVLIGKGITYDTGGLSLKPTTSMETMKSDMSGAGVVLGVIYAVAMLDLDINITGIIPATENAIDGKSYKPGDVYISYSGKSVEVENTDAEGRLILADAITYAVKKLNPSRIIDIATLTGAISIALGEEIAGVFSNDDKIWKMIKKSAESTGEKVWRMPLYDGYREKLNSRIADIKNVGGKEAGAITGALFLKEFTEDIPWMHLDIGGCAYYKKPKGLFSYFATGFGVRLIFDFLEKLKNEI